MSNAHNTNGSRHRTDVVVFEVTLIVSYKSFTPRFTQARTIGGSTDIFTRTNHLCLIGIMKNANKVPPDRFDRYLVAGIDIKPNHPPSNPNCSVHSWHLLNLFVQTECLLDALQSFEEFVRDKGSSSNCDNSTDMDRYQGRMLSILKNRTALDYLLRPRCKRVICAAFARHQQVLYLCGKHLRLCKYFYVGTKAQQTRELFGSTRAFRVNTEFSRPILSAVLTNTQIQS
jgi:hypothetical protein